MLFLLRASYRYLAHDGGEDAVGDCNHTDVAGVRCNALVPEEPLRRHLVATVEVADVDVDGPGLVRHIFQEATKSTVRPERGTQHNLRSSLVQGANRL